ncbi:MAG: hypothetical protein OEW14_11935 [Nitrospira sp.]|nr:hypothetical protein [Nitrospira sp.]MDH5319058.1 hypothetical protein [Nitrospira sp.]
MSKFVATCVVMGVKARPSQDGTRTFRNAVLYFEEDTTTLEANISEDHEALYKQMEANKMKLAQVTVNLREFKGQRFIDVTGYQPITQAATAGSHGHPSK